MICSSSLTSDLTPLVLDTSVLINLYASSFGEKILAMIPNAIAIPEIVMRELGREMGRMDDQQYFLEGLIARQKVSLVPLDDAGWATFERLTANTPSLGDGEAATIAIALTTNHRPVIDDAKGRKSADVLIRTGSSAWTLDLLVHTDVQSGLGNDGCAEAIFLALRDGRMRIKEEQCEAVVNLIGVERALLCPSLPQFKKRRERWKRETVP